jgi:hypothetical protein
MSYQLTETVRLKPLPFFSTKGDGKENAIKSPVFRPKYVIAKGGSSSIVPVVPGGGRALGTALCDPSIPSNSGGVKRCSKAASIRLRLAESIVYGDDEFIANPYDEEGSVYLGPGDSARSAKAPSVAKQAFAKLHRTQVERYKEHFREFSHDQLHRYVSDPSPHSIDHHRGDLFKGRSQWLASASDPSSSHYGRIRR